MTKRDISKEIATEFNAVLKARIARERVDGNDLVEALLNMLVHHVLLLGMPLEALQRNVASAYRTHQGN